MAKVTQSKAKSGPATSNTDVERVVLEDKEIPQDPMMKESPFFSTYQEQFGKDFKNIDQLVNFIAGDRPVESDVYTEDMNKVISSLQEQEKGYDPNVKRSMVETKRQDLAQKARISGAYSGMKGRSIESKSMQDQFSSLMGQASAIQEIDTAEQEVKDLASKQLLELNTQLATNLQNNQDEYDRYRQELFTRFIGIAAEEKLGGKK